GPVFLVVLPVLVEPVQRAAGRADRRADHGSDRGLLHDCLRRVAVSYVSGRQAVARLDDIPSRDRGNCGPPLRDLKRHRLGAPRRRYLARRRGAAASPLGLTAWPPPAWGTQ